MAFGNNISLGMIIGGAVGASFASAIGSASSKIDIFRKKAEKARGFQSLIGDTIRLREELVKAAGTSAFTQIKEKHDKNIERLKQHGIGVKDLKREYDSLGRTVKGLELGASGRAKVGEGIENIKESGRTIAGVVGATVIPTMAAANYESIIRDIAIKGGIARTGKETELGQGIRRDAQDSGIDRNELAQAVNTLVAGGMEISEAASMARTMARFSISQNAQSEDVAKMILSLRQAGITDPALMEKTLGKVAVAGDLGSFEAKDMAKHFASLMPQMTAFGLSGDRGTVELANMLQTQMKAAGSTDEAANNLANLLSKITSEDSKAKFAKQGFDLTQSMQGAVAKGLDPITAFLRLIQEATRQTDPGKAAKMAELQKQVAEAQDPAAAQKMLNGYLEIAGLSEFISDRQAKQAALAVLQNQKLHESNLKLIQSADGEAKIEKDLADRRAASAQKWREAGQAFDNAMVSIGDALRPITDSLASMISSLGNAVAEIADKFPGATQMLLAIASAFAALKAFMGIFKIGGGIINILRGGLMAAGGAKITGALNLPGGAASAAGGLGKVAAVGKVGVPLLGSFAGGYAIGSVISSWIDKGLSAMTGGNTTLGGWIYDKLHPEQAAAAKVMTEPSQAGRTVQPADAGRVAGSVRLIEPVIHKTTVITDAADAKAMTKPSPIGRAVQSTKPVEPVVPKMTVITDTKSAPASGSENKQSFITVDNKPVAINVSPPDSGNKSVSPPVSQQNTFSPTIHVTVNGDVKDPRQIAGEIMPHLKRMFEQEQSRLANGVMFDSAHAS